MEGMFADPVYGGNKDFAGWKLVEIPRRAGEFHAAGHAKQKKISRACRLQGCRRRPKVPRGGHETWLTEKTDVVLVGMGAAGGILAAVSWARLA